MKRTIVKVALLALCTLLLITGVVFAVSASTLSEPQDDVKNAFGGDRNLYLFPGTRAAEPTGGWQTVNVKLSNTYGGVDFSSGDAMWFDFDYYRDANVVDDVQIRLRSTKNIVLFSITSGGKLTSGTSFSAALSETIPGDGWHHITAKYFQMHTENGGVYDYTYGLTLWLNGTALGTTYIPAASESVWVSTNGAHLYAHNGSTFANNTNLASYIYSGTKDGALVSSNTTHYVMLRDFYVNCLTDAQHAAKFSYAPITYSGASALRPNATVSGSLGDSIQIPENYTAATDADGNAVSYRIVDVNWYYAVGAAQTVTLPTPVSAEGTLFAGWFTDSSYKTQITSLSIPAEDTDGVTVYARSATASLAKWALFPGAQYISGALYAGWQTNEFGATDTATVDLSQDGNAMWWDFDYYRDEDTTKPFDIRFVGTDGSSDYKKAVFQMKNNLLTPVSTFYGTQAGIAIEGDGWHHISIAFRQSTAVVSDAIDHTFTATVYLDGVEKETYTVTNEAEWTKNHYNFYDARLTESGAVDYILLSDDDAAENGVYRVKPYYFGGDFYLVNGEVDTSRFMLYLRNTTITYGSFSPYASISRVTFSAGDGELPKVAFDAWNASEWSLGFYLPLAADGRLPAEIVDVSVDKTTGNGYGPANYAAMVYYLTDVENYYFAGATGALPTPTLGMSLFGGWYTNPELTGEPVTSYEELSGDVTLYAKYEAVFTAKIVVDGEEIFSGKASVIEFPDDAAGYVTADGRVYVAGETLLLEGDETFYGVGVSLLEGASIRLSAPAGIRFETLISEATDELLDSLGFSYKIGTLILPTDKLPANSDFTAAALAAARIAYVDLTSEGVSLTVDENGDIHFYAALVEILSQNYVRSFSAISYIELESGERIYSDYDASKSSRSVYEVARAAYLDGETQYTAAQTATITAFLDSVLVLEDKPSGMAISGGIDGYTSPYTFELSADRVLTVSVTGEGSVENIKTILISGEPYTRGWTKKDGRLTASYIRGAYMEYEVPDNFFDEYTDPFGMTDADYKEMTVALTSATTYTITYEYGDGSSFVTTFVQKWWGVWMMGAIKYIDASGTTHTIHGASTDYEFVMVAGNNFNTWRGGNHGGYANITNNLDAVEGDPTTLQNDRLLAIAFYDGKSGEKIELAVGESKTVNGFRVVMYNNIYEKSYTRDNVLFNVAKSYLYNGDDIHVDSSLYAAKESNFNYMYIGMLPIYKAYGNCMKVTLASGETVYAKTGTVGGATKPQQDLAAATKIELWGENHSALHTTIEVHRDESNGWSAESTRLWDMNASANKVYFRVDADDAARGTEWHLATTWSFEYLSGFSYDGEFDYLIGTAAN